jgi:dihydrofolate reductase
MGNVVIDMSMSLDGYIAAPDDTPGQGLGEDGMRLHRWMFDDPAGVRAGVRHLVEDTGAVIMGRRTYDNSIEAWSGKGPLQDAPCFVVTHRPVEGADPLFTFVTDGIDAALAKAREAAGDKRIGLMGANLDQQFLAAGLVDEIRIHVVDVLLGGGRRLFDVLPERIELDGLALDTDGATHLSTASSGSLAARSPVDRRVREADAPRARRCAAMGARGALSVLAGWSVPSHPPRPSRTRRYDLLTTRPSTTAIGERRTVLPETVAGGSGSGARG